MGSAWLRKAADRFVPTVHKALALIPALSETVCVVHAWDPST